MWLGRALTGGGGFGRSRRVLAALSVWLVSSGCFAYTEVSPAAVPPGSYVRIRVDPTARLNTSETLVREGQPILGKLLESSSEDTLVCSVLLRDGDSLSPPRRLRGAVAVPVAAVERLEVRHFEKSRTAALIGAGVLTAYVVLDWAFNVTNPGEGPAEESGEVENARVVLFRWRW